MKDAVHKIAMSNAVVAGSFCSLLAQGAKDAPRTAGDWGWHVKPQSADMLPNVLRGIACDNFGHSLFDLIVALLCTTHSHVSDASGD